VRVSQVAGLSVEENKALRDGDSITKEIFICADSKRPYRLVSLEVDFYKKHDILLPANHPDIRYAKRLQLRP
jgi:hypothetical protein